MKFLMNMDEEHVELLLRLALLDDAPDASHRIAALSAGISVHDDGEAWIILDKDLWSISRPKFHVEDIAESFGLKICWISTFGTFPFITSEQNTDYKNTSDLFSEILRSFNRGQ